MSRRHPYYIELPELIHGSVLEQQILWLCDGLRALGCDAYVLGRAAVAPGMGASSVSKAALLAHYRGGLRPIRLRVNSYGHGADFPSSGREFALTVRHEQPSLNKHSILWRWESEKTVSSKTTDATIISTHSITVPLINADQWSSTENPSHPASNKLNGGYAVYTGLDDEPASLVPDELRDLPRVGISSDETLITDIDAIAQQLIGFGTIFCFRVDFQSLIFRYLGKQVVYVPNDVLMPSVPSSGLHTAGSLCAGRAEQWVVAAAEDFKNLIRQAWVDRFKGLESFVDYTQTWADSSSEEECWPIETVAALLPPNVYPAQSALANDRAHYARLAKQSVDWLLRMQPTESDADEFASLNVATGISDWGVLLLDSGGDLSTTLDSIAGSWVQPKWILIHSSRSSPVEPSDLGAGLIWWNHSDCESEDIHTVTELARGVKCILVANAGTELFPFAFLEMQRRMAQEPMAQLVFSDSLVDISEGRVPWLKGGVNKHLLRAVNYIGSSVLLSGDLAVSVTLADTPAIAIYEAALRYSFGRDASRLISYVPKALYVDAPVDSKLLEQEKVCLQAFLRSNHIDFDFSPTNIAGARRINYRSASPISLVVPAWFSHGYLIECISACLRFCDDFINEVLVVAPSSRSDAIDGWLADSFIDDRIRVVSVECQDHERTRLWNEGVRLARNGIVAVLDDDVELADRDALAQLSGLVLEGDVAVAAGRLLAAGTSQPILVQGQPVLASVSGLIASFTGSSGSLLETGPFGRLQMIQDVPAVLPGLVAISKKVWTELQGFEAGSFPYAYALADFCFRAATAGYRTVWSPASSAFHHGYVSQRRLVNEAPGVIPSGLVYQEDARLTSRWATGCSSWSLQSPHWSRDSLGSIEVNKVIEWSPKNRAPEEVPRVLALPVHGGSADYRVIEPLRAVESEGRCRLSLARAARGKGLSLTVADALMAQPDVVILQNSIADGNLDFLRRVSRLERGYRIIQTIDDLVDQVPDGHPNKRFSDREAASRVQEAIRLSDALVVSTQPLADRYGRFANSVVVVPNRLNRNVWGSVLDKDGVSSLGSSAKPRIGWVGAQQHFDDLKMIAPLVEELSDEVDWVFMGMCPDSLRRYVAEYHGFVPFKQYPEKMLSLHLDLAIAPLVDNPFNECKSNLRLLEYGAMAWPVICSDVYPYRHSDAPVVCIPNDLAVWKETVRELVNDREAARQLGRQLKDWVCGSYVLQDHLDDWHKAYLQTS